MQVATKALGCADASNYTLAKEYLFASRLYTALEDPIAVVTTTTKYKPVALKTKPVIDQLPLRFRIVREIKGDPLRDLPVLPEDPPMFIPTARYSQERKEIIDKIHKGEFLWPKERDLLHQLMMLQQEAFTWDDTERGHCREDFFPPVKMPVI